MKKNEYENCDKIKKKKKKKYTKIFYSEMNIYKIHLISKVSIIQFVPQ